MHGSAHTHCQATDPRKENSRIAMRRYNKSSRRGRLEQHSDTYKIIFLTLFFQGHPKRRNQNQA